MAKHHPDLIMCRKQPGIAIGRLCEKCDGKCVICDSYVRPCTLVRVCDECNYGSFQGRCVICGGVGISDAYYCKECTQQEKDRDGCPKIVNLGSAKTDLFYEHMYVYADENSRLIKARAGAIHDGFSDCLALTLCIESEPSQLRIASPTVEQCMLKPLVSF
ncbi:PHD finger-like domain-containing protein 5B, partial [Cucurbita argyrosperma subsp. argyrosperma]